MRVRAWPSLWPGTLLPVSGFSTKPGISKTFGAGDRADAPERAAKLALEHMTKTSSKVASHYWGGSSSGVCVLSDESSGGSDQCKNFSEESYLRTYHLAMVMLRAGNAKRDELYVRFEKGLDGENGFLYTWPIFILMWFLYGHPSMGIVASQHQLLIAQIMAFRMHVFLGPDLVDRTDGKLEFKDGREQREKTQHKLTMYCRPRLLQMADRFRKFGLLSEALNVLNLLPYGRPQVLVHVMQADFYVGTTVVLQNLKKVELNGSVGSVEKAFDPSTGRVGVEIGGEVEGDRRMVSIKPANLKSLEDDTNLTIDVKILHGQLLCDATQASNRFNPPWMPVTIHVLRSLLPKLRAKVAASRGVSLDTKMEVHGGQAEVSSLFSSDHHRLFRAELSLAYLLARAAGSIGMGAIPPSFGGGLVRGENKFNEIEVSIGGLPQGEDAERCKKWLAARFLLEEAKEVLGSCCDITPEFIPDLELAREKDWVDAKIRTCSGVLTHVLSLPLLPIPPTTGADDANITRTCRENLMVAASILRTHFERMLLDASEQCDGVLTVKSIITSSNLSQHFVHNLLNFSEQIASVYGTALLAGLPSFGEPGEGEGHLDYLKLSVALSFGYFGQEHHRTHALLNVLQRVRPVPADGLWMDDPTKFSIDQVNKWLGKYTPRYLNTSREHPALLEQLSGEASAAP